MNKNEKGEEEKVIGPMGKHEFGSFIENSPFFWLHSMEKSILMVGFLL